MNVAVSVPDPVFDAADRLAKAGRVPRSQVFSEALEEYVAKHGGSAITARLNAVYDGRLRRLTPYSRQHSTLR